MEQVLLVPIHKKSPIDFGSVHLHLTLAHSRGENQGHSQFHCEKFRRTDDGRTDGRTKRRIDGQGAGQINGRTEGRIDGRTDGLTYSNETDERINRSTRGRTVVLAISSSFPAEGVTIQHAPA